MKKLIGIGVLILLLGMITYRIATHGEASTVKSIETYQAEKGIPVEVQAVKRGDLMVSRDYTGTIEGVEQADAEANTTQEVIEIYVTVGDIVRKGQLIAKLDVDIASNVTLKYNQSKATLQDAQKDLERMKSLFEAGAISEQAYEKAKLRYDVAQQDFEAARKVVNIVSPISGTVTHIFHQVGETVASGMPVARIARLNEIIIKINIPESEIAGVQNGQTIMVSVAAHPNQEFPGKLENLSLSADPVTRTFEAWGRVNNRNMLLKPGMFAKVKLLVIKENDVLTISKDAIIKQGNKSLVYIVGDDNIAETREITTGMSTGTIVQVLAGISEGDQVVILGHNRLEEGKKVNIVNRDSEKMGQ